MGGNDPHREYGVTGLGTPVGQIDESSGFNLPNENQTISGKIDTSAVLPANYNVCLEKRERLKKKMQTKNHVLICLIIFVAWRFFIIANLGGVNPIENPGYF